MHRLHPILFVTLAALLWPVPRLVAGEIEGRVTAPSPVAQHEVWLVTDLDLTTPGQPVARGAVDPTTGEWRLEWEGEGPSWLILRQHFAPAGGPSVDLFLPHDLMPMAELPAVAPDLSGVDPELLMRRERLSLRPQALLKWLLVILGVLGAGFGLRFGLRHRRGPEGRRCAPLAETIPKDPISSTEQRGILAILGAALILRLQGLVGESLDLLEVSYLPGIGRPSPFAEGATGIAAIPGMLAEMGQLYCLDLVHPPLYHLVLGVMRLFGPADWLLRLPGLTLSLATCWLLWRLMRRWGTSVGLGSAAIYAFAGPSIYFGQDATPYAAVGLVAVASVHLMVGALEQGRSRDWTAYFAVITAGFFCHYNLAILGIAEIIVLLAMAWSGRRDRRWAAAIHRAMGPALAIAPLPLFWVGFHISTFPTVAQDTRLVADTYARDPGWLSFLWDFYSVNSGLDAGRTHWAAGAAALLIVLGAHHCLRGGRQAGRRSAPSGAGILLLGTFATFLISVAFFYLNVRQYLGGRVFYGFRWVGWSHPLLLALIVLGALRGSAPGALRAALAAIWLVGLSMASWTQVAQPSRPDYAGVTNFIRQNLEDRDAVATLPAWFQRGNLSHYLMSSGPVGRQPEDGEGVWLIDGKRVVIEAVHPTLPFESTAINSHYKRLWVAKIDEKMSGRAKFSEDIADQALAWADRRLQLQSRWTDRFSRIELSLYSLPKDILVPPPGTSFLLSSSATILNHRTYPPTQQHGFVPATELHLPQRLGSTVSYQSPMTPGCVDWPFRGLRKDLDPEALNHWYLLLRLPKGQGGMPPIVSPASTAQMSVTELDDAIMVRAVGGPCDGPPLELRITY